MNREDFRCYPRIREDHILRHSRVREGTVASSPPGCRVQFPEQLLMLNYC